MTGLARSRTAPSDEGAISQRWGRWGGLPLWFPIGFFLASRALNAIAIAFASSQQIAVDRHTLKGMYVHTPKPADPGYWEIITNWDGQWYESIAVDGYRVPSADDSDAQDASWAWAFPPLFPMTVRALMVSTGLSFPVAVTALNLVLGVFTMALLYRVLDRLGGTFLAVSGVALTCSFISAPLLQAAYSETLALLLLVGTFWALSRQSYWLATSLVLALALTRLITPPLALVVVALLFGVWERRRSSPITIPEVIGASAVGVASLLGVWLWSWLSLALAPTPTGATARTTLSGDTSLGWFSEAYRYLGWLGPVLVALLLASLALAAHSRWTRDWGPILRTWLWAYPLYVLAATPITGGILRYLLLCPPLAMLAAGSRGLLPQRTRVALVVGACVLGLSLQYWWISKSLVITHNYLMP